MQNQEAADKLRSVEMRCKEAASAAQRATEEDEAAVKALADARRSADAVHVLLQTKKSQGLETQAQELEGLSQIHDNLVHQ